MADFSETKACKMLAAAIKRAGDERGVSLRQIGKLLRYKQAVVLSHMALGRVPIPIDRAEDLAQVLEMNPAAFLAAVVEQRHPDVDWSLLGAVQTDLKGSLPSEIEAILGGPLDQLSANQRRVMREAAADPQAHRRWLSIHEVPTIEMLRARRPKLGLDGLSEAELISIADALA